MTYYYNGKPYVPDLEMWRKHFVDMAKGLVHPDVNGRYRVGHVQSGGTKSDEPQIQMVTPVAQAIELAKSELALESKVYKGQAATRKSTKRKAPKKTVARKTVAKKRKIEPVDVLT
jgi:hypothetical protein